MRSGFSRLSRLVCICFTAAATLADIAGEMGATLREILVPYKGETSAKGRKICGPRDCMMHSLGAMLPDMRSTVFVSRYLTAKASRVAWPVAQRTQVVPTDELIKQRAHHHLRQGALELTPLSLSQDAGNRTLVIWASYRQHVPSLFFHNDVNGFCLAGFFCLFGFFFGAS